MMDGSVSRGRRGNLVGLWIGLVATGVVAGVMAQGCTSEHDTQVYPGPEAGASQEGGSSGDGQAARCPSDTPVDPTTLGWKPPTTPQQGKCQDADITAMKGYLSANPGATNEDFENFVKNRGATCHDCIFADADGQTWPPAPVKDGKVVTFNIGACYAITTGSQPCGRAVQNAWDCGFEACSRCLSPDAVTACRAKARTGACVAFEDKVRSDCGALGTTDEICGAPFDSIRVQCQTTASPLTDAGTD